MTPRSPRSHEIASVRRLLTGLTFDIKILKLRLALQRKHWSEQPRAPAGQPTGGQWVSPPDCATTEQIVTEGGTRIHPGYRKTAETCQDYIAANFRGSVNREFLKQFLDRDVSDLKAAAWANEPGAKNHTSYCLIAGF